MLVTMLVSGCMPTESISPGERYKSAITSDETETTISGTVENSGIEIENDITEPNGNLTKQDITIDGAQDIIKNELMIQDIL